MPEDEKKRSKNKDGPPRSSDTTRATITKVDLDAGYVSTSLKKGIGKIKAGCHVTFSAEVWTDHEPPRKGQIVILSDFRRFTGGWRAMSAAPVTPDTPDIKEVSSNEDQ